MIGAYLSLKIPYVIYIYFKKKFLPQLMSCNFYLIFIIPFKFHFNF